MKELLFTIASCLAVILPIGAVLYILTIKTKDKDEL